MSNDLSTILIAHSIHLMPPAGDGNSDFGQDRLLWVAHVSAVDLTDDDPSGGYTAWGKGATPLDAALNCVTEKAKIEAGDIR